MPSPRPSHVKPPSHLSKSPPVPAPEPAAPTEETGGPKGKEPTRYGETFSSTTPACDDARGERPAPVIPDFASTTTPVCSISSAIGASASRTAVA